MSEDLKGIISKWLEGKVDAFGFAPVERFQEAPQEHHPSSACKDAATVIVYGRTMPKAVLDSPRYGLHLLQRCYHTLYPYLDQVGLDLANRVESEGYPAVQVPSYAPMVFHGLEPWGILSLKHAAVLAGLGAFGRSETIYHPEYGSLLRLGAVITGAVLPGDTLLEKDPCPPKCRACQDACPAGAFKEGTFQKLSCLGYAIKHGIYRLALGDDYGRENIEMIINTTGYNYWIDCDECLKACPNNRK
jgi:epoxyqueuosine reductase